MGIDCKFIAQNVKGLTPKDIEQDFYNGVFPKSDRRAGPECGTVFISKRTYDGFIVLHDMCRLSQEGEYQKKVLAYLRTKCGGRAGVFGDTPQDTEDIIDHIHRDPEKAWFELEQINTND